MVNLFIFSFLLLYFNNIYTKILKIDMSQSRMSIRVEVRWIYQKETKVFLQHTNMLQLGLKSYCCTIFVEGNWLSLWIQWLTSEKQSTPTKNKSYITQQNDKCSKTWFLSHATAWRILTLLDTYNISYNRQWALVQITPPSIVREKWRVTRCMCNLPKK